MEKHIPNLLAALWTLAFLIALISFGRLVRPNRSKNTAKDGFNSGEAAMGKPWIRMSARYQPVVAIAALFFLGVLLFYPSMATFHLILEEQQGLVGLIAIGVFLGTLSIALGYAWTRGDLSWVRNMEEPSSSEKTIKEDNGNSREHLS